MSQENQRFMRMLVFYDLPVTTPKYRRIYTLFRRFLLRDGYVMVQFSIYARLIHGLSSVDKHLDRLRQNAPAKGSVRCMVVTEKQYASMIFITGEREFQEKTIENGRIVALFTSDFL